MSDTESVPKKFPMRQHLRKYGAFTPQGIVEAMEASRQLPVPKDPAIIARLGHTLNNNTYRKSVDLPPGVAWRLLKLSDARGVAVNRILREIVTYYIMAISEAALDSIPALYADFTSDEGTAVLATAIRKALSGLLPGGIETVGQLVDAVNKIPEEDLVRPHIPPVNTVRRRREVQPASPPPVSEDEREELAEW